MASIRLTIPQKRALHTTVAFSEKGVYMPYANEARTFEACERKGVLEYRSVSDGHPRNGYALTKAGRDALAEIKRKAKLKKPRNRVCPNCGYYGCTGGWSCPGAF